MALRILLADDHDLVRDGVKPFLKELDPGAEVVEANDFTEALEKLSQMISIDLAILDLSMPGMNGISGITRMREEAPDSRVVILSGYFQRDDVIAAIEAGAAGFIPKTMSGMAMVNALRLVLSGETYLPSVVLTAKTDEHPRHEMGTRLSTLTEREMQVLGLLIEGKTNKMIGRELGLEEITIKLHLRTAYRKLGAANRADAVRIAFENGWNSKSSDSVRGN